MNKEQFLSELRQKLSALAKEEREAAITYYEEYFNDAGVENEQSVINELGSVDKVVNGILNENNYPVTDNNKQDNKYNDKKDSTSTNIDYGVIALMIILCIFALPVILPIFFSIFGILIGLLFGGMGILLAGGIVSVAGIVSMFLNPLNGLLVLGIGLILFSIGMVLTSLMINLCAKGIPALVRAVVKICKYPFQKGGINI